MRLFDESGRPLPPLRPIFASAGAQPRLSDIVGRQAAVARLWLQLCRGSVTLNEPRRMGKSSLLSLMSTAAPPNWLFVLSSVQGVSSSAELARALLSDLHAHQSTAHRLGAALREFFTDSEIKVGAGPVDLTLKPTFAQRPLETLEAALESVAARLAADRVGLVIAWDEFPDMITAIIENEGAGHAGALLGVLRRIRQKYSGRLHWLLTGSVGMHHALRRLDHGSSYTTDLDSVPLGPLSPDWARWLAGSLLVGAKIAPTDAKMAELAHVTDGIPFLSHLLVRHARTTSTTGGPIAATTDELFIRAIGDLDSSSQATHLLTRVDSHYGEYAPLAEAVLDRIAQQPVSRVQLVGAAGECRPPASAVSTERAVRQVLDWLVLDHYLVRDDRNCFVWRYPALRRVWMQRRS